MISLFTLLGNGQFVEPEYNHDTFDVATECEGKSSEQQSSTGGPLECCGDYPVRYSYNGDNGNRDCCGQHVFNVNVMSCCEDESVAVTCEN